MSLIDRSNIFLMATDKRSKYHRHNGRLSVSMPREGLLTCNVVSPCQLLPSATVVAERLCFHRCLSAPLWTVGRHPPPCGHVDIRQTPPPPMDSRQTPFPLWTLGRHPPWTVGRSPAPPSWTVGRHPPRADTIPAPHSRDGYCSGRYASYWNAFLFILLSS